MAIEEILASLEIQADARVKNILESANEQVNAIRTEANERAKESSDAYIAEAVEEQNLIAVRDLNAEHAAYRRSVAGVKREIYEEVFTQAAEKIKTIRDTNEYPAILARLVADATQDLDDGYILHVDPRDKELVNEVCKGLACAIDIHTAGGVVVTSADGRIRRSSTFEDRLQRVREEHVELVSEVLDA